MGMPFSSQFTSWYIFIWYVFISWCITRQANEWKMKKGERAYHYFIYFNCLNSHSISSMLIQASSRDPWDRGTSRGWFCPFASGTYSVAWMANKAAYGCLQNKKDESCPSWPAEQRQQALLNQSITKPKFHIHFITTTLQMMSELLEE